MNNTQPCRHSRRNALQWLTATLLAASTTPAPATMLPTGLTPARQPRLVTISGAVTEVVYALGAENQLVGTDTTSLYPEAAQKTAKVGYMRQLSAEGLLSLRPDAVIATDESGPSVVIDQLRSAGIMVELIHCDYSWGEVQRKVQVVGRITGKQAPASALQARLDADWDEVQKQVRDATNRRPRVLFILGHGNSLMVAGEKTAAHAVIGFAGGINALSGPNSFNGYRPISAEAMASVAPDVILTSSQGIAANGGVERFWQRPELALTPAYARRQLVTQEALLLLGFGPRLPQAVAQLHRQFRTVLS